MELSLKYRLFAPKVALVHSLLPIDAPNCKTFATLSNRHYCNIEELVKSLEKVNDTEKDAKSTGNDDDTEKDNDNASNNTNANDNDNDNDNTYELAKSCSVKTGSKGPLVILYSQFDHDHSRISEFSKVLRSMAETGQIILVYRHMVNTLCKPSSSSLAGYGVELEILEFGKKGADALKLGDFVLDNPLGINNFDKTGFQAIQAILDSKDPLVALSNISENVPLVVKHLNEKIVPTNDTIDKNTILANRMNLPDTMISINGAEVSSSHFELETFLEFALEYEGLVNQYLRPLLPKDASLMSKEIMISIQNNRHVARFDTRTSTAICLNNLIKDQEYSTWPKAYSSIMRPPTFQFYPLARNAVLLTIFFDISSIKLTFLEEIIKMLDQKVPIQISLILGCANKQMTNACALAYAVYTKFGRIPFIHLFKKVNILYQTANHPVYDYHLFTCFTHRWSNLVREQKR